MSQEKINVEVAYALPSEQTLIQLAVDPGTTMYDAVQNSGLLNKYPELDLDSTPMGIFGKAERKPKERVLEEGERVEIYRPLIADPKEVRKKRAAEVKARRENEENQ